MIVISLFLDSSLLSSRLGELVSDNPSIRPTRVLYANAINSFVTVLSGIICMWYRNAPLPFHPHLVCCPNPCITPPEILVVTIPPCRSAYQLYLLIFRKEKNWCKARDTRIHVSSSLETSEKNCCAPRCSLLEHLISDSRQTCTTCEEVATMNIQKGNQFRERLLQLQRGKNQPCHMFIAAKALDVFPCPLLPYAHLAPPS